MIGMLTRGETHPPTVASRRGLERVPAGVVLGTILFMANPASSANGEEVVFVEGGRLRVEARWLDSERGWLELGGPLGGSLGGVRVSGRLVAEVRELPTPDQVLERSRPEAGGSDAGAWYEWSWRALTAGRPDWAAEGLSRTLRIDPDHPPACRIARRLETWFREESSPADEAALHALDAVLEPLWGGSGRLERLEGRRFVVLHPPGWRAEAQRRLNLLDQVGATFLGVWAGWDLRVAIPARKAVHVVLPDAVAYRRALDALGASRFVGTRGYYDPRRRVAFTHAAGGGRDAETEERRRGGSAADPVPALLVNDAARLRRVFAEVERRRIVDSATAHETIHQLVDLTGFEPTPGLFPQWFHEGLAMLFETVEDGRWSGVGAIPASRGASWRAWDASPADIAPFAGLLRDDGFEKANAHALIRYAQAWSLMDHLWLERPGDLRDFIDLTRSQRPESEAERLELWRTVFEVPDSPAFETRWREATRRRLKLRDSSRP